MLAYKKTSLIHLLPEGQLVNRHWLYKKGFSRSDIDYYIRSGHLHAVYRGLYRKPGKPLKWQHLLYSLQEMGFPVHLGGKSALAEKGLLHYLEFGEREIQLFSPQILPKWLTNWHQDYQSSFFFSTYRKSWLQNLPANLIMELPFGGWDWPIHIAQPELAIIEWISEAKTIEDLQEIDAVFDGLTILSPAKVQTALQHCPSILTRRLFGWFCDQYSHPWIKRIDWQKIDLGKGKRTFIKGGVFNKKWKITVPQTLGGEEFESKQPLF